MNDGAALMIRRARLDEAPALLALWKAADAIPSPTDTLADVERALRTEGLVCFVAEVDGAVAGTLIAAFDGWRGSLYRLAVLPVFRRRGIARRLVDAAHDLFAQWGVRRINALVEKDHPLAIAFWTAIGYRHDGRMARFVRDVPPA